MIRTLVEEISELPHLSTTKEKVFELVWVYSHPVSKDMIYEFFDARVWKAATIPEATVTDKGIRQPNKIFVNGAPVPFPTNISEFITLCKLEGCIDLFDWNVETKTKYGFL